MKARTYFMLVFAITALLLGILWYVRKIERPIEDAVIRRTSPKFASLLDQTGNSAEDLYRIDPQQLRNAGVSIITVRLMVRLVISFTAANVIVSTVAWALKGTPPDGRGGRAD